MKSQFKSNSLSSNADVEIEESDAAWTETGFVGIQIDSSLVTECNRPDNMNSTNTFFSSLSPLLPKMNKSSIVNIDASHSLIIQKRSAFSMLLCRRRDLRLINMFCLTIGSKSVTAASIVRAFASTKNKGIGHKTIDNLMKNRILSDEMPFIHISNGHKWSSQTPSNDRRKYFRIQFIIIHYQTYVIVINFSYFK